ATGPVEDRTVDGVLIVLARQTVGTVEQQFRSHQADAVADRRIEAPQLRRVGDVEQNADARAVRGERGTTGDLGERMTRGFRLRLACGDPLPCLGRWAEQQPAGSA